MVSEKNTKQELLEEYKKLSAEAKSAKITVPAEAKGMSLRNTKTDILTAIQALTNAINAGNTPAVSKTETAVPAVKEKPSIPKSAPVKTAPAVTVKEDNELSYFKQEIKDEIEALEKAKALRKKEYAELLEIEQELEKFVSMINDNKRKNIEQEASQAERREAQEKKAAEDTEACETSNQEKIQSVNDALAQVEADIIAKKEALAAERAVETEQYTYDLNKKLKTEDDAWEDELVKREEVIAEIQKETAELQADIDGKAALVAELNAKIDEIPTLIEKAKAEGAEEKAKELGKEYGYKSSMDKKDAEVKIQSFQKQIDRLKADYDAVLAEKNAIQEKLDKAREESNKLQMATVQSTGGVKILSNSDKN